MMPVSKFISIPPTVLTSFLSLIILFNFAACGSSSTTPEPEVEAVNNAPSITSVEITSVEANQLYSYTLTATDADGDTLTLSASSIPSWLTFDATSGVLSGTPADTDEGEHAVTLVVNDGTVDTTQSFNITVSLPAPVNNAPVITSSGILTATVGVEYSYTLTATDADIADVLTMDSSGLSSWLVFDTATGILSGTPAQTDIGDHLVTLSVSDNTDEVVQAFTISVTEAVSINELIIFDDAERADWVAWDCCGGTTPTVETDDVDHGATVEFSIGASPTVMGFTSRDADGALNGTPFNATELVANGVFSFDLKMTSSPGDTDWKLKIESTNAATFVEVNLSSSNEGHASPVMDTWQHYSFNLATLQAAGLDVSAIDVVMVFPAWDTGNGAVYRLDNVSFLADGAVTPEVNELVIFDDSERTDWPAWDCCGGTIPTVETDEEIYGATMEFVVGASPTVMGFTSREIDGAVEGSVFDATSLVTEGVISFDLKMTASPGDTDWKLKVESNNADTFIEFDLSASNEGHSAPVMDTWQHYSFNLSALQTAGLDLSGIDVVLIFPAWGTGEGAVYRIDNLSFLADGAVEDPGGNGSQVDLPITFDEDGVDYTVVDFGGNSTVLGSSPTDANDQVAITTKTSSAETWAGTTMSTDDGLANPVPITLTESTMKVWVYSPDAGIPVRLKLEDHQDPTHTVETETLTTMANTWEELTFDFTNEAPGTEPLNPTLHPDWIFDKASIFFNFGTDGATAGEKTYYWDDVVN